MRKKKVYFYLKTSKISTKGAVANLHPLCSLTAISSEFMESTEKEEEGWVKACCFGCLHELCMCRLCDGAASILQILQCLEHLIPSIRA